MHDLVGHWTHQKKKKVGHWFVNEILGLTIENRILCLLFCGPQERYGLFCFYGLNKLKTMIHMRNALTWYSPFCACQF